MRILPSKPWERSSTLSPSSFTYPKILIIARFESVLSLLRNYARSKLTNPQSVILLRGRKTESSSSGLRTRQIKIQLPSTVPEADAPLIRRLIAAMRDGSAEEHIERVAKAGRKYRTTKVQRAQEMGCRGVLQRTMKGWRRLGRRHAQPRCKGSGLLQRTIKGWRRLGKRFAQARCKGSTNGLYRCWMEDEYG